MYVYCTYCTAYIFSKMLFKDTSLSVNAIRLLGFKLLLGILSYADTALYDILVKTSDSDEIMLQSSL